MECNSFQNCDAPICPFDDSLELAEWYPLESICTMYHHQWIKAQRKIAKKAKDDTTYYTYEMLNRNCRINPGITGLDPEKDREEELQKWLKKHPPKRELSEKERAEIKSRLHRKTA